MDLKNILSKLETEREIISDEEKNSIKKRLASWASSIPHHNLTNFGEQVEILSVQSIPSYVVTLKVQYEIRSIHEGTWPYQGKSIFPSHIHLSNKNDIWSVNLPQVDEFNNAVKHYGISENITTCSTCNGQGEVYCSSCDGHGEVICSECGGRQRVACSRCNGKGRVECSRCWGHGSIKGDSSINYREITCPSCAGQRFVFCSSCAGSGARDCPNCTNGRIVCGRCSGRGTLTCSNCNGAGQLVHCFYLKDVFTFCDGLKSAHHTSTPVEINSKITYQRKKGELVIELLEREINKDVFKVSNNKVVKLACESLLDQAKNIKKFGVYLTDYRILKEKIELIKIKVLNLNYKFSGKLYKAWLYADDKVHAPVSPISEICQNIYNNAQEAFKKKDYCAALDLATKATEMFKKEEYQKFRIKVFKIISSQYLIGAILGGTICPIIGNIIGIPIGFIFRNVFLSDIRTSKKRFFCAFCTSFTVNLLLTIILSFILIFA